MMKMKRRFVLFLVFMAVSMLTACGRKDGVYFEALDVSCVEGRPESVFPGGVYCLYYDGRIYTAVSGVVLGEYGYTGEYALQTICEVYGNGWSKWSADRTLLEEVTHIGKLYRIANIEEEERVILYFQYDSGDVRPTGDAAYVFDCCNGKYYSTGKDVFAGRMDADLTAEICRADGTAIEYEEDELEAFFAALYAAPVLDGQGEEAVPAGNKKQIFFQDRFFGGLSLHISEDGMVEYITPEQTVFQFALAGDAVSFLYEK